MVGFLVLDLLFECFFREVLMETKILVPVDGSDTAGRTLEKIIALKERFPKELTLLHVVDVDKLAYRMIPDFQIEMVRENAGKAGQHVLDSKVAILENAGFTVEARLEFGQPRQSICKIANDEAFQLMIIGRRESTGEIRDVLFGSVANYVLHNVACPVLLF
jgi:nucleotide-binding universal stress UspA family protein